MLLLCLVWAVGFSGFPLVKRNKSKGRWFSLLVGKNWASTVNKTCTKGCDQIKPGVRDVQMLRISSAILLSLWGVRGFSRSLVLAASLLIDKSEPSGIKPPPKTISNGHLLSGLATGLSFIVVLFDRGQ